MNTTLLQRRRMAALAVVLTLGGGVMTGCGSSSSSVVGQTASPVGSTTTSGGTFGPDCDRLPSNGAGSIHDMAAAPLATAAGANPLLSTLATAIKKAGLVDSLNSADGITVFAPSDQAFAKIPAKQLKGILARKGVLTRILKHHMIAGQLTPEQLPGKHRTLAGDTVRITGSSPDFRVGAEKAHILCGNVQTKNATVYIINTVLAPSK